MFLKSIDKFGTSLAVRLAVGAAAASGIVLVTTFTLVYASVSSSAHHRIDARLRHEAAELKALLAMQKPADMQFAVADLARAEGTVTVLYRIVSRDGRQVAESDSSAWDGLELDMETTARSRAAPVLVTQHLAPTYESVRVLYSSIADDLVLQAAMRMEHELLPLRDLRRILIVLGGVGLLATCLVGWIAARQILRPLDRMTGIAQSIAAGNFGQRVTQASGGAELERLAQAFNTMLDHIQSFVDELRQMNDSIAHDIRTVLARVQLAAGRLLSSRPLTEEQESLGVAITENASELLAMLDTIMDLSEINTGIVDLPRDNVDLGALLGELVELFEVAAQEKGVTVNLSLGQGAVVTGDFHRMRRAFVNLIDNAVKYTNAGGRVDVCAEGGSEFVKVTVADTGIGISAGELPRIFDRFYRADKSRTGIGHGLGLSLSAAIVRLHNGEISVRSEEGVGTVFSVLLPSRTD